MTTEVPRTTDTLDIPRLRTFVAIDDYGGFTKAAEALYLSQPTVSQHVRGLERSLGQTLVQKQGRLAVFTPAGRRLLSEAKKILAVHDAALMRLGMLPVLPLTVGSTEPSAEQILPELISTFQETFPHYDVRFQIERSGPLLKDIEMGVVDLALVLDLADRGTGAEVGVLPLSWYAAPRWEPPAPEVATPLVAYSGGCGIRDHAIEVMRSAHRPVRVAAESPTLDGIIAGARAGIGLAVLPNAGRTPQGLVERDGLPALGEVSLRLVARAGLRPEVSQAAVVALRGYFAKKAQAQRVAIISDRNGNKGAEGGADRAAQASRKAS
jgi:DNA-binding transcriptional LysR family regulator